MDIKEKITEWQESHKHNRCCSSKEEVECDQELELVLHVIDTLTNIGDCDER